MWLFLAAVLQRMANKCTKISEANARAELLFHSVELLFHDVIVVAIAICLTSLIAMKESSKFYTRILYITTNDRSSPKLMLSRTQVKSWITCNNSHITHMLNQILPWHKIIQHQTCITNWRCTFSTVWHCEHFVLKILAPLVASPSGMSPIMFLNQQVQYLLRQIGLLYYIFV